MLRSGEGDQEDSHCASDEAQQIEADHDFALKAWAGLTIISRMDALVAQRCSWLFRDHISACRRSPQLRGARAILIAGQRRVHLIITRPA